MQKATVTAMATGRSNLSGMPARMITIGICANEASGDLLGAALVREIKRRVSGVHFVGVAGPRMLAEGCETLYPMERLSVMGLVEVLRVLPDLLRIRRELARQIGALSPAVFIGIDAPDFNLGLERRLRASGLRTVHLVSPTVWAWRPGRVKDLRRSVDLMLSVFPFEEAFLRDHGVPVRYVGHPLADQIPMQVDTAAARRSLGLTDDQPVIALLPGSRGSEVDLLTSPFLQTARWCHRQRPDLRFLIPLVNQTIRARVSAIVEREAADLPLTLMDGRSRDVIAAADCVLTASGTATLETLLLKRPMVVAYRIHPLTYFLVKGLGLVKVPYIAMANLLAGQELAPEFVQNRCRAELMGPALLDFLDHPEKVESIRDEYRRIHTELRHNAAREAADAILELIELEQ